MSGNLTISDWNVDYEIALQADECRILFGYAHKVVLSILMREQDPKRRRLLLHEAARSPNRLAANEYALISECNSKIIEMIHRRESDELNRTILIYDFETKMENIFTDVQLGGEMRNNLVRKKKDRQHLKQQGDAILQKMKEDNATEMGDLEGLLSDL